MKENSKTQLKQCKTCQSTIKTQSQQWISYESRQESVQQSSIRYWLKRFDFHTISKQEQTRHLIFSYGTDVIETSFLFKGWLRFRWFEHKRQFYIIIPPPEKNNRQESWKNEACMIQMGPPQHQILQKSKNSIIPQDSIVILPNEAQYYLCKECLKMLHKNIKNFKKEIEEAAEKQAKAREAKINQVNFSSYNSHWEYLQTRHLNIVQQLLSLNENLGDETNSD